MLKTRVIPTLLWKEQGLVKGVGFDSWRRVGPVLPAVKVYAARDVDELILLDIAASMQGHSPDCDSVRQIASACAVPLTVGGGITTASQVAELLRAGADKIALNSSAHAEPSLINALADRFGAQCIIAGIDVRRGHDGELRCYSHCGTRDTGRDAVAWAQELASRGAGEILLTSIDRDGTMTGYDVELTRRVADAVDIPVIASGGAGSYADIVDVVLSGHASAVAAASMFHFTEQTPVAAKRALAAAGVAVRLSKQQRAPVLT